MAPAVNCYALRGFRILEFSSATFPSDNSIFQFAYHKFAAGLDLSIDQLRRSVVKWQAQEGIREPHLVAAFNFLEATLIRLPSGGVAEWSNAPVLKTGVGGTPPWVRIPPPPPETSRQTPPPVRFRGVSGSRRPVSYSNLDIREFGRAVLLPSRQADRLRDRPRLVDLGLAERRRRGDGQTGLHAGGTVWGIGLGPAIRSYPRIAGERECCKKAIREEIRAIRDDLRAPLKRAAKATRRREFSEWVRKGLRPFDLLRREAKRILALLGGKAEENRRPDSGDEGPGRRIDRRSGEAARDRGERNCPVDAGCDRAGDRTLRPSSGGESGMAGRRGSNSRFSPVRRRFVGGDARPRRMGGFEPSPP